MVIGPPMPSWGAQLRIIQAYVLSDCDGKLWLWGKFASPVAGDIALAYLSFDVHSFVKRLIRVPGARQNRHMRRGNRSGRPGPRRRGPGGIPELSDMAADIIDPERDLRPPSYRTPTQFLFVMDDVVERFGYTIMLFESVGRLAWEPFAAILQSDKRLCPDIPRLFSTSGADGCGPEWLANSMTKNEVNIGWTSGLGPTSSPLWGPAIYIFAGNATNISDGDNEIGARVLVNAKPEGEQFFRIASGETGDFIVSVAVPKNGIVAPQTRSRSSWSSIVINESSYFGFGGPE